MPFDIASALSSLTGRSRQQTPPTLLDHRPIRELQDHRMQERVEQWLNNIATSELDAIDCNELSRHASLLSSSDNLRSDFSKLLTSLGTSSASTPPTSAPAVQAPDFITRYPYVSLVGIGIGGFTLGALGVWSVRRLGALGLPNHIGNALPRSFFTAAARRPVESAKTGNDMLHTLKRLAPGVPEKGNYPDLGQQASTSQVSLAPFLGGAVYPILAFLVSPIRRMLALFGPSKIAAPPVPSNKESAANSSPAPAFAALGVPTAPAVQPKSPLQYPLHRSLSSRSHFGIDMPAFRAQHPTAPVNASFENHTYTPFSSLVHRSASINYGLIPSERLEVIPAITCTPLVDGPKTGAFPGKVDAINKSGYVWDIVILDPLSLDLAGEEGVRWTQLIRMRQGETALAEETQVRKVKLDQHAKLEWLPFDVAQTTWVAQLAVRRQIGPALHSDYIRIKIHEKEYVCELVKHEHPPHRYRIRGEIIDGVNPIEVPKWIIDRPELQIVDVDPLGDASRYFVPTVSHPTVVAPKDIAIGTENRLHNGRMTYPDIKSGRQTPPFYRLSVEQHSLETWNNAVHVYHVYDPLNDDLIDAAEVLSGQWSIEILKMGGGEWADAFVRLKRFDVGSLSVSGNSFDCQMHLTESPRVHVWEFHTTIDIDSEIGVPSRFSHGAYHYGFKASERGWLLCDPEFDQDRAHMRYM